MLLNFSKLCLCLKLKLLKMDIKNDLLHDKRFAINVTIKFLHSFVISVTT